MNRSLFIIISVLVLLSGIIAVPLNAQTQLEEKVDSLFVIASSGILKYRDMTEPAKDSLAALGEDIVPQLVSKFTTTSARKRLTIIQILRKIGSPAVPYLISSLKNPNGLVVQRVCWALGDIADSTAVNPLIEVSRHTRWQVRDQALGALGDIKDVRGIDAVTSGLSDSIGQVRKAAAVSTGDIGINKAIPQLVHLLGDDFYGARMSAMDALLKLDTQLVMTTLIDSINSENHFTGSLGCKIIGQFKTETAIDALKDIYETTTDNIKIHAAAALLKADPEDLCGYHKLIFDNFEERLSLLKLNSILSSQ